MSFSSTHFFFPFSNSRIEARALLPETINFLMRSTINCIWYYMISYTKLLSPYILNEFLYYSLIHCYCLPYLLVLNINTRLINLVIIILINDIFIVARVVCFLLSNVCYSQRYGNFILYCCNSGWLRRHYGPCRFWNDMILKKAVLLRLSMTNILTMVIRITSTNS